MLTLSPMATDLTMKLSLFITSCQKQYKQQDIVMPRLYLRILTAADVTVADVGGCGAVEQAGHRRHIDAGKQGKTFLRKTRTINR